MQLIPLAQTPTVSNVRRLREGNSLLMFAVRQEFSGEFSSNCLARQESSQVSSSRWAQGIQDEPLLSIKDRNSSEAPSLASEPYSEPCSEPYWLAMSELASNHSTRSDTDLLPTTTYRARSFTFLGNPQDTISNYRRHIRTSPRHNRNTGLECPMPERKTKGPMRSDNFRPHLQHFHKITSESERQSMVKATMLKRLDSNGIPQRWSWQKLDTD